MRLEKSWSNSRDMRLEKSGSNSGYMRVKRVEVIVEI